MAVRARNRPFFPVRAGIVLAAGEGRRLRHFVLSLRGDGLPKQYVNVIGNRSMLEHTLRRAEKLIPSERLFTVVGRDHLNYPEVQRQLSTRPGGSVIVQPENKETAPGLLLPLMYLCKRYPNSSVVVFPSDHFVLEEDLFMQHVDLAFRTVEEDASRLVLLGVEPDNPDPGYGYILPGEALKNQGLGSVRRVRLFSEKPDPNRARKMILAGGLWNTMVMVFRAETLLKLVRVASPGLYRSFRPVLNAIGTIDEKRVVEELYRKIESMNFSKGILEALPPDYRSVLSVLPVRGVLWTDWGSANRVLNTFKKKGGNLERVGGVPEDHLFNNLMKKSRRIRGCERLLKAAIERA